MIEAPNCKQRGMRSLFWFKISKRTVGLFSFFMVFISAFLSKLEIIFCVFLPLKGVLKRTAENSFGNALTPLKGVLRRVPFIGV